MQMVAYKTKILNLTVFIAEFYDNNPMDDFAEAIDDKKILLFSSNHEPLSNVNFRSNY